MILIIIGAALTLVWGISHLIPTKSVVENFGNITVDNKRIITMEWINEGLTLIFIGVLVILTTVLSDHTLLNTIINLCVMVMLLAMSILSLFTGFKVKFLPYKLCPFIFCSSVILIGLGTFLF